MLPPCSVVGHRAAGPHCSEVKSERKADGTFAISNFLMVTFLKLAEDELKFYIMYFILFKIVSFWHWDVVVEVGVCLPTMQGALRPIPSIHKTARGSQPVLPALGRYSGGSVQRHS